MGWREEKIICAKSKENNQKKFKLSEFIKDIIIIFLSKKLSIYSEIINAKFAKVWRLLFYHL